MTRALLRLVVVAAFTLLVSNCCAQHLTSFSFTGLNGSDPMGGLVADASGQFYGTTYNGGNTFCQPHGCGLVYEISLSGYKVLYEFTGQNGDGANPIGNLVMDAEGNLYGVTAGGGVTPILSDCALQLLGCGIVFELSPPLEQGGAWTETILYQFQGAPADGAFPQAGLVFDGVGNLYGTTMHGGPGNNAGQTQGTAFELSPPSQQGGAWTESVLYLFGTFPGDGKQPAGSLIFDGKGNLYGTTFTGGPHNGTMFELSPPLEQGSAWTETILFSPITAQCTEMVAGMVMGPAGALYGVCQGGGQTFAGAAFRLQPPSRPGGQWTFNSLHNFIFPDSGPSAPMIFIGSTLYGTDELGLFSISFSGQNPVYTFLYQLSDPQAPVLFKGVALYGTTARGGGANCTNGCGTVFQLTN